MRRYYLAGLTGQSGAGKSTVSRVFSELGAKIIDADAIVREIYVPCSPCVTAVAAAFGSDCLLENGGINRKVLAERAFSSPASTALLGRIVHPFVTARFFELLRGCSGLVVYDAPQLFESGADIICDCVIAVTADRDVRISRIRERDCINEEQAEARVKAQLDEEFFRSKADFIIENNGGTDSLRQSAAEVFRTIVNGVK